MRDEVYIKCMENSLWAQYIIEFFKFVGFSVLKETYGDIADKNTVIDGQPDRKGCKNEQINIIVKGNTKSRGYQNIVHFREKPKPIVIWVYVDENNFSDAEVRINIGNSLVEKMFSILCKQGKENEYRSLPELFSQYEEYDIFHCMYNEGLIKYSEDYYNGLGETNGLKQIIDEACIQSKAKIEKCYHELVDCEANDEDSNDRYKRYAILLLRYKLNDLQYTMQGNYVFSSKIMLSKIDGLVKEYPYFMRALYLAARICRADTEFNYLFIPYINKAIDALEKGKYSEESASYLYYQVGKYCEVHGYEKEEIKKIYEYARYRNQSRYCREDTSSKEDVIENCFVSYKLAKYLYETGDTERAVELLKKMKDTLVDSFEAKNLQYILPKRQIHGYKICASLGNIEFNRQNYTEAKKYYKKAIQLAIKGSSYFHNNHDDIWREIFRMCLPLYPISRKMIYIFEIEYDDENRDRAEKLKMKLYKEKEKDLKDFWIDTVDNV